MRGIELELLRLASLESVTPVVRVQHHRRGCCKSFELRNNLAFFLSFYVDSRNNFRVSILVEENNIQYLVSVLSLGSIFLDVLLHFKFLNFSLVLLDQVA